MWGGGGRRLVGEGDAPEGAPAEAGVVEGAEGLAEGAEGGEAIGAGVGGGKGGEGDRGDGTDAEIADAGGEHALAGRAARAVPPAEGGGFSSGDDVSNKDLFEQEESHGKATFGAGDY